MESQEGGATELNNNKDTFINTVFNFDTESKGEMLNIIQYSLLCIIPIVVLNKAIHRYIPEADENKRTLEISAEVIVQIIIMFIGLMFIHRIVTYVPTYSELSYDKFSLTNVILVFMMLMLSLQTKLGEKVNILLDRLCDLWEGKSSLGQAPQSGHVRITQPGIANPLQPRNLREGMVSSRQDTTNIANLPQHQPSAADNLDMQLNTGAQPPLPTNFDSMYGYNGSNQQQMGAQPGMGGGGFEPMAANSMGGGFGSSF